jgi:hypothetical protein
MSVKTDVQLKANTDTVIVVNGNREITPPLDNGLRTDIIDSKVNVNGGNVIVALVGYTTELTPSDNKHLVPKKYVDDEIAGVTITTDATPTNGSSNPVQSNGVFDELATKLNLSGGTMTGTLRTADGDAVNKAIAIGGPATGFWRDRAGTDEIRWLYNGVEFLSMSETLFNVKNTLRLDGATASTVVYLDASKNIVSLANGAGVLSNDGSGGLSWVAGGSVTSVSGTSNRITSTGGTTPVIDIAATYVGQTSITTLGTIATGVWQGTIVSPTYGGTGVNNASKTITLGGNLVTSGAFNLTLAVPQSTTYTLPNTSNETLAGLGTAQTFTAVQRFTGATTEITSITLLDTTYKTALDVSAANTVRLGSGFTGLNISTIATVTGTNSISVLVGSVTGTGLSIRKATNVSNIAGSIALLTIGAAAGFDPTSGNATYTTVDNIAIINQTGTANGAVTLYSANPTVTSLKGSLYGYRSQIAAGPTGGGTAWNIYADGTAGNFFGGFVNLDSWIKLKSYTVAGVPSAATAGAGAQIYVSNESGGAVPAFSDGTDWRRVTDRAVIS